MKGLKLQVYKYKKIIIYALIAFCVLVADYRLFFKSTIVDLKKTLPEVSKLKKKLVACNDAKLQIPKLKAQIMDMQDRLSSYNKRFSTKEEKTSILEELSATAKESEVKILAVKPYPAAVGRQPSTATGAYQKFPILIKAKAGYHQLGSFINKLENAATFMRITYIKITGDPQTPLEHDAELVVNTYILTEGA